MSESFPPLLPDPEGIASPVTGEAYPAPPLSGAAGQPPPAAESDWSSTTEMARGEAGEVAQSAKEGGQRVIGTAAEEAGNVTHEVKNQAAALLSEARSELGSQAGAQQRRLAEGLRSLSDELHSMADANDQPGPATQLARQGAELSQQVSTWFDDREPGQLLDEVRRFARRRPGTFLLLAVGAGVLAGRATRGLKDDGADSTPTASPAANPSRDQGETSTDPLAVELERTPPPLGGSAS